MQLLGWNVDADGEDNMFIFELKGGARNEERVAELIGWLTADGGRSRFALLHAQQYYCKKKK